MTSKHELSIYTGYVPTWGVVEAFRELFQNALDNEINNPENKMEWAYDKESGTIKISNKTSKLTTDSLLLGSSTKANDSNTIGKHGEGYKIAFMVLMRNNKQITVYNYGAKEVWKTRLVKSKKYNGTLVPTIFVEKEAVWKKVPDSDLTIEVSGITEAEYMDVVQSNLHLRDNTVNKFEVAGRGSIILDKEEQGNIYVKGLYVTSIKNLQYGYDFEPSVLGLDRDRKLVDSFNVTWESSILWQVAANEDDTLSKEAVKMFNNSTLDVRYIHEVSYNRKSFSEAVATDFIEENGTDAIPVTSNSEYEVVKKSGCYNPVFVNEAKAKIVRESHVIKETKPIKIITIQEQLLKFIGKIESRLSAEELTELTELVEQVKN